MSTTRMLKEVFINGTPVNPQQWVKYWQLQGKSSMPKPGESIPCPKYLKYVADNNLTITNNVNLSGYAILIEEVIKNPIIEEKGNSMTIPISEKPYFKSDIDQLPEWKRREFQLDKYWDSFEKTLLDTLDKIANSKNYQHGLRIPSPCHHKEEYKLLMTSYKIKEITGILEGIDYDQDDTSGQYYIFLPEKVIDKLLDLRNSPSQKQDASKKMQLVEGLYHALFWRKACSQYSCEKEKINTLQYGLSHGCANISGHK